MSAHDIHAAGAVSPKAPHSLLWKRDRRAESQTLICAPSLRDLPFQVWEHIDGFAVITSVETAVAEGFTGEQYHLCMHRDGARRCSSAAARFILRDFGMADATEIRHQPGVARHFWRPVTGKDDYIATHGPEQASTHESTHQCIKR